MPTTSPNTHTLRVTDQKAIIYFTKVELINWKVGAWRSIIGIAGSGAKRIEFSQSLAEAFCAFANGLEGFGGDLSAVLSDSPDKVDRGLSGAGGLSHCLGGEFERQVIERQPRARQCSPSPDLQQPARDSGGQSTDPGEVGPGDKFRGIGHEIGIPRHIDPGGVTGDPEVAGAKVPAIDGERCPETFLSPGSELGNNRVEEILDGPENGNMVEVAVADDHRARPLEQGKVAGDSPLVDTRDGSPCLPIEVGIA